MLLSFIFNLSGFCLLASIIYLIHYGLYMAYEKMITHVNNLVQYFYPIPVQNENMPKKITLESLYNYQKEFNEELDNLDGWKTIQNKDTKKLKEEIIILKKDTEKLKLDFSILKFDNDLIINNMKNEIATLKININKNNENVEKKLQDIKNVNSLEYKDMNNKIFKIKCMVDK